VSECVGFNVPLDT